MLVSVNAGAPAGGGGVQYFIGDFDGHTFTGEDPSTALWLDYGPDNYAGTTWNSEPNNRRIYIGWMNNWEYAAQIPTSTWRGATTMPRQLRLVHTAKGTRLAQAPLDSFEQLRTKIGAWDNLSVSGDLPLNEVRGRTLEIVANLDQGTARRFGMDVHRGETGKTHIVYNTSFSQLLIGRAPTPSSGEIRGFTSAFGAPVDLDNQHLRLQIFVDESSVEVFADDGLVTMTGQTYVDSANNGVFLFAEGGTAQVTHLEVYSLPSVWPKDAKQSRQAGFNVCD
jgi:fructan beta-fructosidase